MISIVCPTYNSSYTVDAVINSILSQTNTSHRFEIIFIDDGSTDNTEKIIHNGIKKLRLNNIDAFLHVNSHKGAGAARNLGIAKSRYDYVAFIDSDDVWYENKIEMCEKSITNNPGYNIFVHDEIFIRNNKRYSRIINGIHEEPLYKSLYIKNCFSTSAVVIKKELLNTYGSFDESLMSSQDYELWLRLSRHLKVDKMDEVLGEYRESEGSITSQFYLYRVFDQLNIARKYKGNVSRLQYYRKYLKIIFSKQWLYGIKNIILGKKSHNY